jgi:predicted transcriptional regulator
VSEIRQNLKTLRRIDVNVVRRIIIALHEDGKQKKSKVALMAHMSYDKCLRYLEWLEMMGMIKRENSHGCEHINLTDKGMELYHKYSRVKI